MTSMPPSLTRASQTFGARIADANARPGEIVVITIGAGANTLMPHWSAESWNGVRFFDFDDMSGPETAGWQAIASKGRANLVILIADLPCGGVDAEELSALCYREGVKLAAIFIGDPTNTRSGTAIVTARRYAETIAIVADATSALGILHGIDR
jgi:hypothetical protein